MLVILFAHAVAALLAPSLVRVMGGRNAFLPLSLVPLGGLGWVLANWGTERTLHITWAATVSMDIDMRFDSLAAIMSVLVLGIGA